MTENDALPPLRPRSEKRIPFASQLRFESHAGIVALGYTTNVSLSGAFMHVENGPPEINMGDEGVVFLDVQRGEQRFNVSFPCKVARITPEGYGLDFESEMEG